MDGFYPLPTGNTWKYEARKNHLNLNILGLSKVRWKGAGCFQTGNHTFLYSGGDKHEKGVGMLLDSYMIHNILILQEMQR